MSGSIAMGMNPIAHPEPPVEQTLKQALELVEQLLQQPAAQTSACQASPAPSGCLDQGGQFSAWPQVNNGNRPASPGPAQTQLPLPQSSTLADSTPSEPPQVVMIVPEAPPAVLAAPDPPKAAIDQPASPPTVEPLKTCLKSLKSSPSIRQASHVQICEPAKPDLPKQTSVPLPRQTSLASTNEAPPDLKLTKSRSLRLASSSANSSGSQIAAVDVASKLFAAGGNEKATLNGQHAGLKLWEGNKSKAEVPRLGVRILQAQIYDHAGADSQVWDPFASVKCERSRHLTRTVPKTTDPEWDEYFVFEVKSPAFAVLRIKVYDKIRCWQPSLVGEVRIQVKSISDAPAKYAQPTWQTLHSRKNKEARGRVQIQLNYLSMRMHRPLTVMCCTWNVGNAPPPDDLSSWLKGVEQLEHDIVAIGVQECTYRVKEQQKLGHTDTDWSGGEPTASFVMRGTGSVSSSRPGSFTRDLLNTTATFKAAGTTRNARSSGRHLDTLLFTDDFTAKRPVAPAVLTARRRSLIDDEQSLNVVHQGGAGDLSDWLQYSMFSNSQRAASTGGITSGPVAEGLQRVDSLASNNGPLDDEAFPGGAPTPSRFNTIKRTDGDAIRGIRDVWEDRLKEAMGPQYWMVRSVHMGQMRLVVFARNDIVPGVSHVSKGSQATGVAGVATNKGGVAIALQVWDTELCFINSHLAAHQDKSSARNMNYRDIVRGLRLDPHHMDILTAYHHVFWMGDLNYRLDYGHQAIIPTPSPMPTDYMALLDDIDKARWPHLLAMCQLRREMRNRHAFLGFSEAEINFAPTFKVQRQTGMFYKSQRSPAWCDRVLYRSNLPMKQVRPLNYFMAPDVSTSDHKPVSAIFSVPTIWKQDEDGQQNVGIVLMITQLAARGLFMLRQTTGTGAVSSLPNTQIILKGPCMKVDEWRSGVAKSSRNPVWVGRGPYNPWEGSKPPSVPSSQTGIVMDDNLIPSDPVTTTPLKLALKTAALQDLANRRLLVRAVQIAEGKVVGSGQHTIARAVLPLFAPAMQLLQSTAPGQANSCTFTVPMEYNGLPAGWLDVECSLEVVSAAANSMKSNSNRMSTTASSIMQNLSSRIFRWTRK